MKKTKTIYFLSAIVCIIGCYALNLSYSLFVQTEEKPLVDATVPSLSYSLETSEFTIPANSGEVVKLKVINSGTADIKYGISVSDTLGTTIQLVEKEDNYIVGELKASTTEGETSSKEVLVYVTNPTDSDITLTFNLIAKYNTLNFDEDFIANSNIDCINTVKLLKDAIIARANSITESDSKTKGYAMYSETLRTTPAAAINGADESLLLTTEDDHTVKTGKQSYYFRGNVKDNYVNFANMCWRIVRIAGDGSIKLILEDQYTLCNDNESVITPEVYTGNWIIGTGNYGYELKDIDSDLGDEYIMNYLKPVTINDLSMAKAFYNFQITKLSNYTSKLKSGDWCLGNKAYIRSGSAGSYTYTPLDEINYHYNMYYDAYTRLSDENENGYQPTFICNGKIMNDWEDNETNPTLMYVGALTADEIIYAGSKFQEVKNLNYYLINDYQKNIYNFWTLTPLYFDTSTDYIMHVSSGGYLSPNIVSYYNGAFRPTISLLDNTIFADGEGTINKPYQIK